MDEKELLRLLIDEPKEGIRKVTQMYSGLIYALTSRRLAGRLTHEDIEECVSDIFFEFYQYREQIDLNKGTLKSVLLIIAERKAIKYYSRRTSKFDKVSVDSEDACNLKSDIDVENQTIQNDESRRIIKCIKELGEPDSTIMIQKYYYNMTAKEIGHMLGMTKNAVEKRAKRNLVKLRGQLGE